MRGREAELGAPQGDVDGGIAARTWNRSNGRVISQKGAIAVDLNVGERSVVVQIHQDRVFDGQTNVEAQRARRFGVEFGHGGDDSGAPPPR